MFPFFKKAISCILLNERSVVFFCIFYRTEYSTERSFTKQTVKVHKPSATKYAFFYNLLMCISQGTMPCAIKIIYLNLFVQFQISYAYKLKIAIVMIGRYNHKLLTMFFIIRKKIKKYNYTIYNNNVSYPENIVNKMQISCASSATLKC